MTLTWRSARCAAMLLALGAMAAMTQARANHFILPCKDQCAEAHWTMTGALATARTNHTATLLRNGKVLVAGGSDSEGNALSSAELYDPTTGARSPTSRMTAPRSGHFAFLLATGAVLVIGGDLPCCMSNVTAETYDPDTGDWSSLGPPGPVFGLYGAARLASGEILLVGARDYYRAGSLRYDVLRASWTKADLSHTDGAPRYRQMPDLALLPDGTVLESGGSYDADEGAVVPGADVYDPLADSWARTGAPQAPRLLGTMTALNDGGVLVTGGFWWTPHVLNHPAVLLQSSEIYRADGTWHSAADLNSARYYHTATLLSDGRVLVAGGASQASSTSPVASLQTAEIYDPETSTWAYTDSLNDARYGHTATLLSDGAVLIVGGWSDSGTLGSAEIFGRLEPSNANASGEIPSH